MKTKRHAWGVGIRQACQNKGCPWFRSPRDGRHGMSTTVMLYAKASTGRVLPDVADFAKTKTPPCEGEK